MSDNRSTRLERRYRRLLACYPWEHRRVYEEEMLNVLLSGTRPEQRFPSAGDIADILFTAFRKRLTQTRDGFIEPAWRDAAATAGLLMAVLVCAIQCCDLAVNLSGVISISAPGAPGAEDWALAGCSLIVVVTAIGGLRRIAAGMALLGALGQFTVICVLFGLSPLVLSPTLLLSLISAIALSVPAVPRRGATILGPWRIAGVAAVSVVAELLAMTPRQVPIARALDLVAIPETLVGSRLFGLLCYLGLQLGVPILLMLGISAQPRRRVLAILAAPMTMWAMMALVETGYFPWLIRLAAVPPIARWILILGLPFVILVVGNSLLRRRERSVRLRELGMMADRELAHKTT